jgi:hypothetical protein
VKIALKASGKAPAGDQVPDAAAEVGAAEERVEGRPDPEDRRRGVGLAHCP